MIDQVSYRFYLVFHPKKLFSPFPMTNLCYWHRERKMIKSLQYVLMIQNISTLLTTRNLHLIASWKFDAFLKTVSITILISFFVCIGTCLISSFIFNHKNTTLFSLYLFSNFRIGNDENDIYFHYFLHNNLKTRNTTFSSQLECFFLT